MVIDEVDGGICACALVGERPEAEWEPLRRDGAKADWDEEEVLLCTRTGMVVAADYNLLDEKMLQQQVGAISAALGVGSDAVPSEAGAPSSLLRPGLMSSECAP